MVATPATWLERKWPQIIWSVLASTTITLVSLWLGKTFSWPVQTKMGATGLMIFIALAVSLAGFAQGLTGFGFGLVAVALLPLLMPLKAAVTLTALLSLVVSGRAFFSIRHQYCWRQGLGLIAGACVGVPAGIFVLVHLPETVLLRILGGLMLLFSANELILNRGNSLRISSRLGFPFGLASGGLSGAFGVGGPPAIAFTYSQSWSKEQIVAVLQVVFGVSALIRILLLGQVGFLSPLLTKMGLWSLVPLLAAIAVGQHFFARIPQPVLKQCAFAFLWGMGLKYLLFP